MNPIRNNVIAAVNSSITIVQNKLKAVPNTLYVGVSGDSSPKGDFVNRFPSKLISSVDIDPKYGSDYVFDISNIPEPYKTQLNSKFDLIICAQVIDQVREFWKISEEFYTLLKPNGFLYVDCPFIYPYHNETNFPDYWRISPSGLTQLFNKFKVVADFSVDCNSSILFQKKENNND